MIPPTPRPLDRIGLCKAAVALGLVENHPNVGPGAYPNGYLWVYDVADPTQPQMIEG